MTNYQRGAIFERRVKARLEACGYFVLRSAGSHSPVDLCAFKPEGWPLFVQCARDGHVGRQKWASIAGAASRSNALAVVASVDGRRRLIFRVPAPEPHGRWQLIHDLTEIPCTPTA